VEYSGARGAFGAVSGVDAGADSSATSGRNTSI